MSKMTEKRYKSLPAGVRNNNYLNIKKSKARWRGSRKVQRNHPFVEFDNPAWGYRAAFIIMGKSYRKRGIKTVADIISTWAPNSENNTAMYIAYCHSELINRFKLRKPKEIEMPEPLSLNAFGYWTALAKAMTAVEIGRKYADDPQTERYIYEGYIMAFCEDKYP